MPANYLSFFNLNDDSFRLTPDIAYFYNSPAHATALKSLEYCVTHKEGFCVLTGDPGTGKTTILRLFTENWKDRAEIALIMTPRLMPDEFFRAILDDFKIPLNASKNEMLKSFRDFLLTHAKNDKRVAIIVDEAQELPDTTLEELRLLSNLETGTEKLLQIILIGQPELSHKLLKAPLRQLNQRITVRVKLKPLTASETSDYINTRLIKAGNSSLLFHQKAKELIFNLSHGIPRTINLLASRGLMSAFLEGSHQVLERHVEQGAADVLEAALPIQSARSLKVALPSRRWTSGKGHRRREAPEPRTFPLVAKLCLILVLALAVGLYAGYLAQKPTDPVPKVPAALPKPVLAKASSARQKSAPAPVAAPGPTFASLVSKELSETDPHRSAFASFNELAEAWRVKPVAAFEKPAVSPVGYLAELASRRGMELISFDGNLEGAVELGYPLILKIKPAPGDREIFAPLTGVSQGEYLFATQLGGKKRLTRGELESVWQGKAVILWKNYEGIPSWIPKERTPVAASLKNLLTRAGTEIGNGGAFEGRISRALTSYQGLKGLEATGKPDPKTLLYLYRGDSNYFHPKLEQ